MREYSDTIYVGVMLVMRGQEGKNSNEVRSRGRSLDRLRKLAENPSEQTHRESFSCVRESQRESKVSIESTHTRHYHGPNSRFFQVFTAVGE